MILTINKNKQPETIFLEKSPEVTINVQEGAKVIIIDSFNCPKVEINVDKNALVDFCTIHQDSGNLSSHKRGMVKENGELKWMDIIFGKENLQLDVKTYLQEAGANVVQLQACLGNKEQEIVINSDVVHQHSHTTSLMKAKGVLYDKAKMKFKGTIKIPKNSAGCKADQRTDTLLLGEEAKCDAMPILEVENDDVKCSHGASIGQIDEEQMFYLLSRGLDEKKAEQLIVKGILESITKQIKEETTREKVVALIR